MAESPLCHVIFIVLDEVARGSDFYSSSVDGRWNGEDILI